MNQLVWFRSDLRTHDNPALWHASSHDDRGVVGLFLISSEQWQKHGWGSGRVRLMMRMVGSLAKDLAKLNIPLLIRHADVFEQAPEVVDAVAREYECQEVHVGAEYEINEVRRDKAVGDRLAASGRRLVYHTSQVALPPGEVTKQDGGWYTVFTPFKNRWLSIAQEEWPALVAVLPRPKKQPSMLTAPDDVPLDIPGFETGIEIADLWVHTETDARTQLRTFIDTQLGSYACSRDTPSIDGTSSLSPYLTHGVLSARECIACAVEARDSFPTPSDKDAAATWITELIWREFYKHLVTAFPTLSMHSAYRTQSERIPWSNDEAAFEAWCTGKTGIPIVDAGMRQLVQTGWMHNRLRMITAMFLTKNLLIDWRRGEAFFMHHLVDGDLASNNGGWQWSASTGTDAAPYFRIMNPARQAARFDPDGVYIKRWVPELSGMDARSVQDPEKMSPRARAAAGYPEPIVDLKASRLRTIEVFKAAFSGD